jgi:hypothetical protein
MPTAGISSESHPEPAQDIGSLTRAELLSLLEWIPSVSCDRTARGGTMADPARTLQELTRENDALKKRIEALEATEARCKQEEESLLAGMAAYKRRKGVRTFSWT